MIRLRIFIKIMQIYFWEYNLRNVIMIYILGRVLLAAIFILFFFFHAGYVIFIFYRITRIWK